MAVSGLTRSRAAFFSALDRLKISPEELRARGARAKAARAWDALVAENAALRLEVESLRRENSSLRTTRLACVTPSPGRPADSESDLD
jgi:regulator of replication initiation timing